ncbi:MAG: LacI family DNA-binding transcriptional regulator [Verrucomicrobia bacterium]|nr:LacI family DNA-binding transcriptional regulator [Verrucomicrobiota bacterium]
MTSPSQRPRAIRSTAEFARYVGLSRSAVSRVLNDQPGLRASTIARVRQAMAETGFTPNAHAALLRGKPSSLIGVCLENLTTHSLVRKLSELQEFFAARGYTALVEVDRPGGSRQLVQQFLALRVQAIVFIGQFDPAVLTERIALLRRHGTPHVVVDHSSCRDAPTVTLDRGAAMEQVVSHLHGLGHRRFGLLGISGDFQTVTDRLEGLRAALARRGLEFAQCTRSLDAHHVRQSHFEFGRLLAADFARQSGRPSAFIAVNDETAAGAQLEFQRLGVRVPEEVSIVGFDNRDICQMVRPQLTSVDQQVERTARVAAEFILASIGRPLTRASLLHTIEPQLIVRGSSGPLIRR